MARQQELFNDKPARAKSRVRAHVVDAGNCPGGGTMAMYECRRCGWKSGWRRSLTLMEPKKGVPCERCNTVSND